MVELNEPEHVARCQRMSYYGKSTFKNSLDMTANRVALLNTGVLSWMSVAATFAILTVDRLGRKPLFIMACGGMGLSMAGLSFVWAVNNAYTFGASVAVTFFLFLFMAFFPLTSLVLIFCTRPRSGLRTYVGCYAPTRTNIGSGR